MTLMKAARSLLAALAVLTAAPAYGVDIQYTYDKDGQLRTVAYGDQHIVRYKYDAYGNRIQRVAEACVSATYTPVAENDTMVMGAYGDWELWVYGAIVDVIANDTSPGSYPLIVEEVEGGAWIEDNKVAYYGFGSGEFNPPTPPASFTYTVSNGHCRTDTATITVVP